MLTIEGRRSVLRTEEHSFKFYLYQFLSTQNKRQIKKIDQHLKRKATDMWICCVWSLMYIVVIVTLAPLTSYWISNMKDNQEIVLHEENGCKETWVEGDTNGQNHGAILGFISDETLDVYKVHGISPSYEIV